MALVLRFRQRRILPTPWLSEAEWRARFKRDLPTLTALLDDSGPEVLQTLGGFRALVVGAILVRDVVKICSRCKALLPIDSFRIHKGTTRPDCKACESVAVLDKRKSRNV